MIELTKLNGAKLVVNSELIEFIEASPDSLITLTTGTKIMVKEKIPEIIAAVVEFRKRTREGPVVQDSTISTSKQAAAKTAPGVNQSKIGT